MRNLIWSESTRRVQLIDDDLQQFVECEDEDLNDFSIEPVSIMRSIINIHIGRGFLFGEVGERVGKIRRI